MSATANRVLLSYIEEVTYGTTPSGNLQEIRMTGESLKEDTETTNSAEIRDDRMISDVLRTMVSASGDIQYELSYGSFDDFLVAALRSAGWTTETAVISASTNLTFAANTITLGTGTWTNAPAAGSWIRVTGATTNPDAIGFYKVTASTTTVITVAQTIADTGAESGAVTITNGAQITNGITDKSFSIERKYGDLASMFEAFVGMEVETLSMSMTAEGLITGSIGFMGKRTASATSTIGTGYVAANTNPIINTTDNVQAVQENNAAIAATAFSFALKNNLRGRTSIGSLGYGSIGDGQVELTGTLQEYLIDAVRANKHLNFTDSGIAVIINDAANIVTGNSYVVEIPLIKYTGNSRAAGSNNTDIINDLAWSAKRSPVDDAMIRIVRFPALS